MLLPLLAPQVDELVVVANTPGSTPRSLPVTTRVIENTRPLRLSANVNLGVASTTGEWVLFSNPDVVPDPDSVGTLHAFAASRGAAASPARAPRGPTGPGSRRGAASRPSAAPRPTHAASPDFPPLERQRDHYLLDEDVEAPVEADWLLGAFLLMRRAMLEARRLGRQVPPLRRGHRPLLQGDARRLGGGTCRAPRHARLGADNRPPVPLPPDPLARPQRRGFVREHPETLARL